MSESKRTPGKWCWTDDGPSLCIRPCQSNGKATGFLLASLPRNGAVYSGAGGIATANAAFIVLACNAHDELVEALSSLISSAAAYMDYHGRTA